MRLTAHIKNREEIWVAESEGGGGVEISILAGIFTLAWLDHLLLLLNYIVSYINIKYIFPCCDVVCCYCLHSAIGWLPR